MAFFVILVCIFIFVFIVAAPFVIGGGLILGGIFLLAMCAGSGSKSVATNKPTVIQAAPAGAKTTSTPPATNTGKVKP